MIFWILVAFISFLAMSMVLYPIFVGSADVSSPMAEAQHIYSARILEIENDLRLGRLTDQDAEAAKAELGRNLLKTNVSNEAEARRGSSFAKPLFVLSALFIPIFTIGIYSTLGDPSIGATSQQASSQEGTPTIVELLAAAERRLKSNPDDADGWAVVAPVYVRLQQFDKAITAYRNAIRLSERKPELTFGLGEALMAKKNGQVSDEALDLFKETTISQPENPVAKFYVGVYDMQQGDNQAAIEKWQAIVDEADKDASWLPTIKSRITQLQAQVDGTPQSVEKEAPAQEQLEMINSMVSGLEARLEENPDDQEGWEMLIRSYMVLGRTDDALTAVSRAQGVFKGQEEIVSSFTQIEDIIKKAASEAGK